MKFVIFSFLICIIVTVNGSHKKTMCPTPSDDEPVINCLLCLQDCPQNQTLVIDPCNCCFNKCVPQTCPSDVCSNCPLVNCINGSILVPNRFCGCCPSCVIPKRGDPCYPTTYDDSLLTCGENLVCSNGICQTPI